MIPSFASTRFGTLSTFLVNQPLNHCKIYVSNVSADRCGLEEHENHMQKIYDQGYNYFKYLSVHYLLLKYPHLFATTSVLFLANLYLASQIMNFTNNTYLQTNFKPVLGTFKWCRQWFLKDKFLAPLIIWP